MHFSGNLTLPSGFTEGTVTSSFSFTGSFAYPTDPNFTVVTMPLAGSGTATLTFAPWTALVGAFAARRRQANSGGGSEAKPYIE